MSRKVSIFVEDDEDSTEFDQVREFLARWGSAITIVNYSSGGWEHYWDLLVPESALAEIPEHWLCESKWTDDE
ncbi:MAG: hypothetical protein FWG75_01710 [Cystobacterineae bacterium]|nr:hypothetical protein [Cystobacterineae bacterium]